MMKRDLRRIIGDTSAGAEAGRIGVGAFEVIEPEFVVVVAGVIFDQRELSPAHWFVRPTGSRSRGSGRFGGKQRVQGNPVYAHGRASDQRGLKEGASRDGRARVHFSKVPGILR